MKKQTIALNITEDIVRLSSKATKTHRKIGREKFKEIQAHFKKDGWPLNWGFLVDDLVQQIMGYNIENLLLSQMFDQGFVLKCRKDGLMLIKNKKKSL